MPIELQTDGQPDELEPGQEAYEAIAAVTVDANEMTLMGLLASLQRGDPWERVPPRQRELCAALEGELFDGDEGDGV
jgi:hypothetical protein